jgi:hypothetical protein
MSLIVAAGEQTVAISRSLPMTMSQLFDCFPSSAPNGARGDLRIEVGVTEAPGEIVVRVAGKGCVGAADVLAVGLLPLDTLRPRLVTLDLGGLSCISCLSMGVLVRFCRGVVRAGGRVRLADSLQELVRQALERAELLALFDPPVEREIADAVPA